MPATFKTYPGILDGTGAGTVEIQQENASMQWDIFQISVSGSNPPTNGMICSIMLNGILLCNSPAAASDTATGPPDVTLNRSDDLKVVFASGIPNDSVNVGIWFYEVPAGS